FGNKTGVERAHHSIAVAFNDGDNRGIAARDEDVARHGAKMRFDLRGLRAGLTEQNSSYHDDGAGKRQNSGASSSPNKCSRSHRGLPYRLPDAFCRRLVLGDVSHLDMLASALGEACLISLDPVPFHEAIHEIEQAANRNGGMQGRLVPPCREDGVGIGLRHARWRQRQASSRKRRSASACCQWERWRGPGSGHLSFPARRRTAPPPRGGLRSSISKS